MLITKYLALGLWGWIGLYALTNEFTLTLEVVGLPPVQGLLAWTGGSLFFLLNLGLHNKIPRWLNWLISAGGLGAVGFFLLSLTSAVVPRRDVLWVRPWSSIKVTWSEKIHLDEWTLSFQEYIRNNPPVVPNRGAPQVTIGKTLEETRQIALETAREWVGAPTVLETLPNPWVDVAAAVFLFALGVTLGFLVKWAVSRPSRDDLDKSRDDLDDFKKQTVQKDLDFETWRTSLQEKFSKEITEANEKTDSLRLDYEEKTPATETSIAQVKQSIENIENLVKKVEAGHAALKEDFGTEHALLREQLGTEHALLKERLGTVHALLKERFQYLEQALIEESNENAKLFGECVKQDDYQNLLSTFDLTIDKSIATHLERRNFVTGAHYNKFANTVQNFIDHSNGRARELQEKSDYILEQAMSAQARADLVHNTLGTMSGATNPVIKVQIAKYSKGIKDLETKVSGMPTSLEVSAMIERALNTRFGNVVKKVKDLEDKT